MLRRRDAEGLHAEAERTLVVRFDEQMDVDIFDFIIEKSRHPSNKPGDVVNERVASGEKTTRSDYSVGAGIDE
ncbi:MAG: hypothetical protein ABI467_17910 [Kofleriaceae bacterium]